LATALKKILRISYREVRVGSRLFWLDPASNFGSRLIAEGSYEKELSTTLSRLLKPGDVFVDLGANEGYFSVLAGEIVGEEGHVYAVEPQARLWPVILRNLMLNGLTGCTLIPYAVGPSEGFTDLLLYPSINTGASTGVWSPRRRGFKRQKVGMMPLELMFHKFRITKVSVLKIDIEGYELDALRSLGSGLHEGAVENILMELHPAQLGQLGQSVEEVWSLLEKNGYEKIHSSEFEHWVRRR